MLNIKDTKATVYKVEEVGNMVKVNLSTSKKDKRTDKWVNSNWFGCLFVGNCKEAARYLCEKDRIVIKSAVIEKTYIAETKKEYINLTVFAFDMADGTPKSAPVPDAMKDDFASTSDSECPF